MKYDIEKNGFTENYIENINRDMDNVSKLLDEIESECTDKSSYKYVMSILIFAIVKRISREENQDKKFEEFQVVLKRVYERMTL